MARSILLKSMVVLLVLNVMFSLAVSARSILKEKVYSIAGMNNHIPIDSLLEVVERLASCSNCGAVRS